MTRKIELLRWVPFQSCIHATASTTVVLGLELHFSGLGIQASWSLFYFVCLLLFRKKNRDGCQVLGRRQMFLGLAGLDYVFKLPSPELFTLARPIAGL
jgi:hypothetical protein